MGRKLPTKHKHRWNGLIAEGSRKMSAYDKALLIRILRSVCAELSISPAKVITAGRKREAVYARRWIVYFARMHGFKTEQVAEFIGASHSQVIVHFYNLLEALELYQDERDTRAAIYRSLQYYTNPTKSAESELSYKAINLISN